MLPKDMSREDKIKLLELLNERERRQREKHPAFADRASPEQIEVLKCKENEIFVFAGNGAGKTAVGAEYMRCAVDGYNPYNGEKYIVPCRAYIILDKPEKIEQVVLPELRKWMVITNDQCHKKGKPYISLIERPNGSTIRFLFWDQNPMTAEGIEGDIFWYEEPPPRSLYIALKRAGRTRGRRSRYLFTGTPLAAPWLRTEVWEPWSKGERKNTMCFKFYTESNRKNLAEGWIEEFSAVLTEKEKGIRLRGDFFDLEGLALSHLFKRPTHTINRNDLNWDSRNPCVLVMDPHPSKAHHAILLGADHDNNLVVLEECKYKLVARQFALKIIERGWFKKYRITDIIFDSLGSGETTSGEGFKPFGTVINEVFSQNGIGRARATTFDEKSDEEFIERIRDALLLPDKPNNFGQLIPKLRVVSDCHGIISDIENVQWKRDKNLDENKPALEISNKDYLSCLKYALATNLYFSKQKDKAFYRTGNAYGFKLNKTKSDIEVRSGTMQDDWNDW